MARIPIAVTYVLMHESSSYRSLDYASPDPNYPSIPLTMSSVLPEPDGSEWAGAISFSLLFTNGEASPPILDSYARAFQPSLSLSWLLAPTGPTLPLISSDAKAQISIQPSPCPKPAPVGWPQAIFFPSIHQGVRTSGAMTWIQALDRSISFRTSPWIRSEWPPPSYPYSFVRCYA